MSINGSRAKSSTKVSPPPPDQVQQPYGSLFGNQIPTLQYYGYGPRTDHHIPSVPLQFNANQMQQPLTQNSHSPEFTVGQRNSGGNFASTQQPLGSQIPLAQPIPLATVTQHGASNQKQPNHSFLLNPQSSGAQFGNPSAQVQNPWNYRGAINPNSGQSRPLPGSSFQTRIPQYVPRPTSNMTPSCLQW